MEEKEENKSPTKEAKMGPPDAVIYTYNSPKELEEMKPEKETLTLDETKISPGKEIEGIESKKSTIDI